MIRKKILSLTIVSCILVTGLPLTSNAMLESTAKASDIKNETLVVKTAESTPGSMGTASIDIPATGEVVVTSNPSSSPSQKELENIITVVKAKISVPKNLSVFEYYYNAESYYSVGYWNLNWSSKDSTERIYVQADQKGNIISYEYFISSDGFYAPKYLKNELKSTADQFLSKIAPVIYNNTQYKKSTFQGVYGGQYIYQYERVANGIPMPDNTVTVGVNFETGKVVSYYGNWFYDVKIPSAEAKITEAEAATKIGKTVTMKLAYQNKYTTDKDGKTKIEAFLVYYPDQAYVAVDAKTGEIYTTQNEVIYDNMYGERNSVEAASDGKSELTQEEIIKVEELAGIISREEAIKAITENKSLLLDKNLKSITARLYKRSNYYNTSQEEIYVWDINFTDPREANYETGDVYRPYANASVDAKTGKILNFNASIKDYYSSTQDKWESVKVKYTMKQGQSILEKFLKDQIPNLFKNSILTDNKESYIIGFKEEKEVYGGYYYNYERVNEGINYSFNGIYGAVDGVTGKIYSYSYNWDTNVKFQSPKNIISSSRAFDYYIANDGFRLVYENNNIHTYQPVDIDKTDYQINEYNKETKIRLVYRTDIYPGYISPFTGKLLDYNGEEYHDNSVAYTYSDIGGSKEERNIRILADLGVGYSGGYYSPYKEITREELVNFMALLGVYYDTAKYPFESNSSAVSRMDVSKLMIQILEYEKVAKIKGIYNIDFNDRANISEEFIGYAVIVDSLGIITADSNNNFRPNANLTRGEAADMLMGLLIAK